MDPCVGLESERLESEGTRGRRAIARQAVPGLGSLSLARGAAFWRVIFARNEVPGPGVAQVLGLVGLDLMGGWK
jgi:hypothetical protein